jgi:GntR family transcriptional regulator, transcriptional repressor for pyruvate dehydrogenase complex
MSSAEPVGEPRRSPLPDAVLRPVREGNAFESTVELLGTAIRLGVFAEGERLPPERELAERLRVGRATLREAIGALRDAGLVTTSRGRTGGTVVVYRGPTEPGSVIRLVDRQIDDVLAFRRVVEPGAAQLAASSDLTADQRSWLVAALEAAQASTAGGNRRVADARLHLAVATLSGSAMVVEAVTQAQASLCELLAQIPVLRLNIEHSDAQHTALVAAVLRGDAEGARRVMEQHCDATSALLRGLHG